MTETSQQPETDERWIEYRAIKDLPPALRNPKLHARAEIRASIQRFGFTSGVLLDERTGRLVAGHGRCDVVAELEREGSEPPRGVRVDEYGVWQVPVQRGWSSVDDDDAEAYLIADNRLTERGGWNEVELAETLQRLAARDEALLAVSGFVREDVDDLLRRLSGRPEDEDDDEPRVPSPKLADRFLIPPFDVLDARGGWWRERKQRWLALGIRSELGRAAGKPHPAHEEPGKGRDAYLSAGGRTGPDAVNAKRKESRPGALLLKSDSGRDSDYYRKKQAVERRLGRELSTEEFQRDYYVPGPGNGGVSDSGTSVFDPVLCELVYRWFCPPGGHVLDPFSGGSVRGVVAAILGRDYTGVDLSTEQIAANEAQVDALVGEPTDGVAETVEDVDVPEWQRGYDLDGLRGVARLFQAHDDGLVLGGFTGVKENNVAEWAAAGDLRVREVGGEPVAAIVVRQAARPQPVKDFADVKRATIPAGDVLVSRMACADGYGTELVAMIREAREEIDAHVASLWVESWTEHPVERAVVEALGCRVAAVKIRASSELRTVSTTAREKVGLLSEPQPEPEVYDRAERATLTRLARDLTGAAAELLTQVEALGLDYADHYSSYNVGHAWKALALRGYSDDPTFIEKPAEMSRSWKAEHPDLLAAEVRDTPLRAQLPAVEAILDAIPGEVDRVRLMRLAPGGGELTRHADITDPDAGVADGCSMRLHVPLRTNPDVLFRMWDLDGNRVVDHMPVGTLTYLDTRKPHTAINGGEEERIHLVIDVRATPDLRELLDSDAEIEAAPEAVTLDELPAATQPYELPAAAGVRVVAPDRRGTVRYLPGDARDVLRSLPEETADLVFTCPPYYGLERYSDDPADLSTMSVEDFDRALGDVLAQAARRLRPNRYAVIVVGDVRAKDGRLIDLTGTTVRLADTVGLRLLSIARLVTPIGSLAVRAPKQFVATRVLGRTHQSVVILYKGDRRIAASTVGPVDVTVPEELLDGDDGAPVLDDPLAD